LDNERNLRYQLEKTQVEMVNLLNEIEHITEVRERNRIAQEIHDNIGHSIAGVLFQLQAADKLIGSNTEKVGKILKLCIEKLSEALETTRNTVFNIRSDQTVGIDRIKKIVNGFKFCKLEFEYSGDFNGISPSNIKILEDTTKEVLTNAMKYSGAKDIALKIDVNRKHIRFYYKDNGVGCPRIIESVGLSSMKERVGNLGGTYSVDGTNGFTIVYTIPNIFMEAKV
jgi:signal transduction histidine kinase